MNRYARRRIAVLLGLFAATLVGSLAVDGPSAVQAHAPDPVLSGGLFAQDQRLGFKWRSGAEPPAAIKTAIRDAAAGINASRASRAATFAYDSAGTSVIGYGTGATCGVNGIACFTRTAPTSFTMWLREQGRVFDWGTLKWCQMYSSPPDGCYDAETIALDEFGHVEILAHHENHDDDRDYLDAVVQTYSRTKPKEGWDEHVLGRCDVATLQLKYDVLNTWTKVSTCLDIDTGLALSANPTSIAYDGTTTLTATLKVASKDAYGRLKGNPLSGRTVRLQRRAPGTTTWSTVATMATGTTTGTYRTSVTLRSTTEFRAVFPTSSTEGLDGSTSPTIKVSVGACTSGPCPLSAGR
jgi:hypothetical protein